MVLKIIRFIRGTVEFLITGAFPEKLLTRAVSKGIAIWGVRTGENGMFAKSYASHYKKIARHAKKTGLKTKVVNKTGMPFIRFRYRKRWGIAAGLFLSAVLASYLLSHIWIIEVQGCDDIPEQTMIEYLEQCGLKRGIKRKEVNTERLEKELLLLENRLSWVTVNIDGTTAKVVVGESVEAPETIDPKDKYANVIASQDGIIRRIELYDGQPLLKVGDTVAKGEVIISGITDDQYDNTMLRYARAKVIAEVYIENSITVPLIETVIKEGKEPVKEREIFIFGARLPLRKDDAAKKAMRIESSEWELLYPLLLVRENRCFLPEGEEIVRTPFEAKEECMRRLKFLMDMERESVCILREENEIIETSESVTLKSTAYAEKDIAETVEFLAY